MRKEYVKPIIESEEFTANEYVAACWTASCLECGATEKAYDAMYNRIKSGSLTSTDGVYVYTGNVNDAVPCSSTTETSTPSWATGWGAIIWWFLKTFFGAQDNTTVTEYHPVNVTSGWDNHPNASV